MINNKSTDDSNDDDYIAGSERVGRPCSQNWSKRAKGTEHNNRETLSIHPLNVSYQAIAAVSSDSMQESEEIPIRGHLTLKTINNANVVYRLTFSQEQFAGPSKILQKQVVVKSLSSSSDKGSSEYSSVQEWDVSGPLGIRDSSPQRTHFCCN